jgi:hypothetical protein
LNTLRKRVQVKVRDRREDVENTRKEKEVVSGADTDTWFSVLSPPNWKKQHQIMRE